MRNFQRYSPAERAELWRRWKSGESLSDIARALGRKPGSVHTTLSQSGGIAPRSRKRKAVSLSPSEREEISRGLAAGQSLRSIASRLGRACSTISREVNRNGGRSEYRAEAAEARADSESRRPKLCKLARSKKLRWLVARKLALQWSPEQISGWLAREYSRDSAMQVSHETIYRSIYLQARGVLKKELMAHLRRHRVMRKARSQQAKSGSTTSIQNEISICDRPAEVDSRCVPGHWEGDLIAGTNNSHVATLVERTTRFTLLVRVDGKDAVSVQKALCRRIRKLPDEVRRSLTWDRGSELAHHKQLSVAADISIYFCDPRSPWQRGTNENTNGLLRQYFPKKTDLSVHSQNDLSKIARRLNERPRKTLDFDTPANVFSQLLQ